MTRPARPVTDSDLAWLLLLLDAGRQRSIEGRADFAGRVVVDADDMSAFGPLGGEACHGRHLGMPMFLGGRGLCETVTTIREGGMVVVVMVERSEVEVTGREGALAWALRTTQVFRQMDREWVRLHRHADPLVCPRSLSETLALLTCDVPHPESHEWVR